MTIDKSGDRTAGRRVRPLRWSERPKVGTEDRGVGPRSFSAPSVPDVEEPSTRASAGSAPVPSQARKTSSRSKLKESPIETAHAGQLSVLHVGSGAVLPGKLHPAFDHEGWREVRLDIDPGVRPDLLSSIVDMKDAAESASHDAIWCSHNLEHLCSHEIQPALREFIRVLKPSGFALIRSPDLEAVAELILSDGLDVVVYQSPAGPITPLDMLYGHRKSIERGNRHMRHGTGFTQERLGRVLIEAGFAEARTTRTPNLEVWALALMPDAQSVAIVESLLQHGLDFQVGDGPT
jgi:SAM-dependent methyltransferase